MSINKKKRLTREEKRIQKELNKQLLQDGIALSHIETPVHNINRDRFLVCVIRSVIIFMGCLGTLGTVVSAFNLPYIPIIVIPALYIVSLLISLLYYNKRCFYIGYIAIFALFLILSINYFLYINSGFQAFLNVMYGKYSDYFHLNSLREGTEYITNRAVTVSFAMIFFGTVLTILLNIAISGYMSLFHTFFLTFPILQVVFYIDLKPNTFFLVLVIACYITVAILRRSSHYRIPAIKQRNRQFHTVKKKNMRYHSYLASGSGMINTAILSIVFAAVFLVVCLGSFYSNFNSKSATNKLKRTTDEYVKLFVQNGILGFFDRYSSTGGLSSGKLGGVSSVRPDYKTDLIIRYVPFDSSTVYLKAYVGKNYVTNQFEADELYAAYGDVSHLSGSLAKMQVENVDADRKYTYNPYDTLVTNTASYLMTIPEYTDDSYEALLDYDAVSYSDSIVYEAIYDPYTKLDHYEKSPLVTDADDEFIHSEYLQVPKSLKESLRSVLYDAGLSEYKKKIAKATSYDEKQKLTLEVANEIYRYYVENYQYTMAPGTTPYGDDVIEYFLTKQKRGYCAHFASSATMLLRQSGIPARYIEGYVIQVTDVMDAVGYSDDMSSWLYNYDLESLDATGAIEVNITDASAHAWVEIYIDGYGWIPFEFTPPSTVSEEMMSDFSLSSLFSALIFTNSSGSDGNSINPTSLSNFNVDINVSFGFIIRPLLTILAIIVIFTLLLIFAKPAIIMMLIFINASKGRYNKAMQIIYLRFSKALIKKKKIKTKQLLIRQVFEECNIEYTDDIVKTTQTAFYSNTESTKDVYEDYRQKIKNISKI